MRQHEQRLRIIKLLLAGQFAAAILAGLIGSFWGSSAVFGALAGGLTAWLPNCYFAFRAFRYRRARNAQLIVRSFYSGVTGKLIITACLFSIVFASLRPLNAPAVFLGYIGVLMTNWIVPLLASRDSAETGR